MRPQADEEQHLVAGQHRFEWFLEEGGTPDEADQRRRNPVEWNPKALCAFEQLKEVLCQHPVLYTPNFQKTFFLQTDASVRH
ncbi:hypothetical protein Y1Q_0000014 [Alligator mississippiensis]|uniref:Reverse transcriptase/retrotransposon-derived protein RNase H-like domain-containing protein n=1 Tax=Alligator mississippiensis TaxID=8496 RepID=A0A151NTS7_ALLMI|nr:hypothetical protein Y1Q_0000014 [Alligator mississippiensis]